jgi:hypothetical protein
LVQLRSDGYNRYNRQATGFGLSRDVSLLSRSDGFVKCADNPRRAGVERGLQS